MRVMLEGDPFAHLNEGKTIWMRGAWPARWVAHPEAAAEGAGPVVVAYKRHFKMDVEATVRLHVSADERYRLWVDGVPIGRGPERGDADHWFFETYEVPLARGRHTLVAMVWSLGSGGFGQKGGDAGGGAGGEVGAPYAQASVYHGLIVACDEAYLPLIATGVAEWEAKVLPGWSFGAPGVAWGTGARVEVDGAGFAWNFQRGDGEGWGPVVARHAGVTAGRMEAGPSHLLRPAVLPAMEERYVRAGRVRFVEEARMEDGRWRMAGVVDEARDLGAERAELQARWVDRRPMRFEARSARRVIVDLENYYCAYPVVVTDGGRGAVVRVAWAESLYETARVEKKRKGDRGAIAGKFFLGVGDVFRPDGGVRREFETLWWGAGRYLELVVETADEAVEVNVILRETRYPLEMEGAFESSDEGINSTVPVLLRGVQVCAHETYVDCPFYEQLMYVGDARLEALVTYAVSSDDRLPRKAIELFDASRGGGGLVQSRYPSRVRQVVPPFALWWVGMVHDYALWRGDAAFVRGRLAGVRAVINAYMGFRGEGGLVEGPAAGWNFVDWAAGWKNGVPPDGDYGASGVVNWQFVVGLRMAAALEGAYGEPELAALYGRVAGEVKGAIDRVFWEPARGMYADDAGRRSFSEHAQCLAVLSGMLEGDRLAQVGNGLLTQIDLTRATVYFSHYLFEACRVLADAGVGLAADPVGVVFERLGLWTGLAERGLVTPPEEPEPSRSDCHGWGSHPLFHYVATVLGVRPGGFGFGEVEVRPRLGRLEWARGRVPHPKGEVVVEAGRDGRGVRVVLPEGVGGRLVWGGGEVALVAGENRVGGGGGG